MQLGSIGLSLACGSTEPDPLPEPTTVIWFGCTYHVDSAGICRIAPDGSRLTVVARADESGAIVSPAASRDGRQVAFTCPGIVAQAVCIMNSDGSNRRRILDDAEAIMPAWSPDGTRLAFSRNWRIWIADTDGSDAFQLTPDSLLLVNPDWSPDGTRIIAGEPGPGDDLWMIDVTGENLVRFSDTEGAPAAPRWSPDGSRILYSGYGAGSDLYVMDPAGGPDVQVRTQGNIGQGDWSPDGLEVAVEKYDGFTVQLHRRTLANEHLFEITSTPDVRMVNTMDWAVRAGF